MSRTLHTIQQPNIQSARLFTRGCVKSLHRFFFKSNKQVLLLYAPLPIYQRHRHGNKLSLMTQNESSANRVLIVMRRRPLCDYFHSRTIINYNFFMIIIILHAFFLIYFSIRFRWLRGYCFFFL